MPRRSDAATQAFDEIAKICGCPEWGYPGQIVRDVERLAQERDKYMQEAVNAKVQIIELQAELKALRAK